METDKDLFIAKLAEQAERFEDMVTHMKIVVRSQSGTISSEIRNLLSVAYKNVIGARRSAWRILSTIENNEKQKQKEETRLQAQKYRERVELELDDICEDVIQIIDEIVEKNCAGESAEAQNGRVFFHKMKGDYNRYRAECKTGTEKDEASKSSLEAYQVALDSSSEMPRTEPILLGLCLNYSVFHYEIMNDSVKACELAKKAFDDAIECLDNIGESSYKDSTLIMQLLRDNLTLWNSEKEAGVNGNEDDSS